MARAGGENFPVAPLVLPRWARAHLMAVYGFARLGGGIGDEVQGDRLALLAWLDEEIDRAWTGTPEHPVMRRLAVTVRQLRLSPEPFRQLVEANRRDQLVDRYETIDALMEYCALSANPVGRLVLEVLGAATPERQRWSDSVCTGLQVAEHLQDVSEDLERGRVYLPQEDLFWFGCSEEDFRSPPFGPEARALLGFEVQRARTLLDDGPLPPHEKTARLAQVRKDLDDLGRPAADPVLVALGDTVSRFPVPLLALRDLVDGVEMDVVGTRYETFAELLVYCRRVAGAVGRLSLAVFGATDLEAAEPRADALGVALQLTNILRDVKEDAEMGRVYLPA